jgi:hypothetical protein
MSIKHRSIGPTLMSDAMGSPALAQYSQSCKTARSLRFQQSYQRKVRPCCSRPSPCFLPARVCRSGRKKGRCDQGAALKVGGSRSRESGATVWRLCSVQLIRCLCIFLGAFQTVCTRVHGTRYVCAGDPEPDCSGPLCPQSTFVPRSFLERNLKRR